MTPPRRLHIALAVISLIAAQFVVYGPALNNSFLKYDDDVYVYENKNIQTLNAESIAWIFARPYYRSYTPLALLSHSVDYSLWKDNPWGHHLTSLLLHTVNVVLMFLLGLIVLSLARGNLREGASEPHRPLLNVDGSVLVGTLIAIAFYSLHPVRVESVAWVSDRKDLLVTVFLLLCIIAYIKYDAARGTSSAVKWFLISLVCFLLAVLSKTIATVTPLLLLSLDWLLLHRQEMKKKWRTLLIEKSPFLILSLGFGILATIAARESQLSDIVMRMSPPQRFLMPFYTVVFYPTKILVPLNLTPTYDSVSTVWMAIGALVGIAITVAGVRMLLKGHPWHLLAWLCYVLTILPTITGLSAGIQPWADRYAYVPSIPLFLLLGGGIAGIWERSRTQGRRLALAGGGVALALLLGFLSRQQVTIWKDAETLWRYAIRVSPDLPMPYANLGVAVANRGDHDAALKLYRTAIQIQPHYADALYNMGVTFEQKGVADSAEHYYHQTILADVEYPDAYINLGNVYVTKGRIDDGIALYHRAIALDSSDPDPYYDLGYAYYQKGDRQQALEFFKKAIVYSPNYPQAYYNMGVVLLDLNNQDAAMTSFVRAARLGWPEAQKLLSTQGYSW